MESILTQDVTGIYESGGPFLAARKVTAFDRLKIFIDLRSGERRPFCFHFRGAISRELAVSSTRAAIFLVLLSDLIRRGDGRIQIEDCKEQAVRLLRELGGTGFTEAKLREQVRLGFYRFGSFWEMEFPDGCGISFDLSSQRLFHPELGPRLKIEIETVSPVLRDFIDRTLTPSAFEHLKKEECFFVPGGGCGSERLLREIYDTKHELRVMSTYLRPSLPTVPPELVAKYVTARESIQRSEILQRKLAAGTLRMTEVVELSSIRKMITPKSDGTYSYYPGMTRSDVIIHLDFLIDKLSKQINYELILTRSDIPFYVATYDTRGEVITIFFNVAPGMDPTGPTCFAMRGRQAYISAVSQLFSWLAAQPSTIKERDAVIAELRRHREELVS